MFNTAASTRSDRNCEQGGEPPVSNPLRAPALRQHVRHVGGGRGEQTRPEHAVDQHQAQNDPDARDHGVEHREDREGQARRDEHTARSVSVGERAGEWCGERRGIRQETEKEPGRERRATQVEDMKGRSREQLERGKKDSETEAAHDKEARREQPVGHQLTLTESRVLNPGPESLVPGRGRPESRVPGPESRVALGFGIRDSGLGTPPTRDQGLGIRTRIHSAFSATSGSTRVALSAGTRLASSAIRVSTTPTATNVNGSVGVTP